MIVKMFKPRFVPLIESGLKKQTIRPIPKRMPEVGDEISLRYWSGKPYRSKQVQILASSVVQVELAEVNTKSLKIGNVFTWDAEELNRFARADGFEGWGEMYQWFLEEHKVERFKGVLIKWK